MAVTRRYEEYRHEPLDTTQRSIRLLSIHRALSPEGFVQGSIRYTTIDAQYNCLSYVWGSPDQPYTLLVDGKRLSVNKNLHDFLTTVRTFTYREPGQLRKSHLRDDIWIDAICIDQTLTSEKNHQVRQMGKIYSNARKVIMWLGRAKHSGRLLDTGIRAYLTFILENEYWTRAWVAQEVFLAKDPFLLVASCLVSFPHFFAYYIDNVEAKWKATRRKIMTQTQNINLYRSRGVLWAYYRDKWSPVKRRRDEVVDLLDDLRGVKCTLPHDQVFSLLELAADGDRIPVEYDMSLIDLVFHVFKADEQPRCLCEIVRVCELLNVEIEPTNESVPVVYAQWEERGPEHVCRSVGFRLKQAGLEAATSSIGSRDQAQQKLFNQVPVQLLLSVAMPIYICPELGFGAPRFPVKLGRGLVHNWKIVTEDLLD